MQNAIKIKNLEDLERVLPKKKMIKLYTLNYTAQDYESETRDCDVISVTESNKEYLEELLKSIEEYEGSNEPLYLTAEYGFHYNVDPNKDLKQYEILKKIFGPTLMKFYDREWETSKDIKTNQAYRNIIGNRLFFRFGCMVKTALDSLSESLKYEDDIKKFLTLDIHNVVDDVAEDIVKYMSDLFDEKEYYNELKMHYREVSYNKNLYESLMEEGLDYYKKSKEYSEELKIVTDKETYKPIVKQLIENWIDYYKNHPVGILAMSFYDFFTDHQGFQIIENNIEILDNEK